MVNQVADRDRHSSRIGYASYELADRLVGDRAVRTTGEDERRRGDEREVVAPRRVGRVELPSYGEHHVPVEEQGPRWALGRSGSPGPEGADVLEHEPSYAGRVSCGDLAGDRAAERVADEIGRASCRERVYDDV